MIKFYKKWWLVVLVVLNLGCQREYVEPTVVPEVTNKADTLKKPAETCPEYYYLYGGTKVNLGEVNTTKIILGFQEGITTEQKEAFISGYPYLQSLDYEYNTGSADATAVLLKEGLTCSEVEAALTQLASQPEIRYATPFFQSSFDVNLIGVTNQFIVNLKPGYTLKDLEKLTRRTKTDIVDQLGDLTFILSADKYATGNALQLANEFAQFYQVESSEPDFLYDF